MLSASDEADRNLGLTHTHSLRGCHKFFYFPYLILSPASIDAPDAPDGADGADAPLYFDALMRPVKGIP